MGGLLDRRARRALFLASIVPWLIASCDDDGPGPDAAVGADGGARLDAQLEDARVPGADTGPGTCGDGVCAGGEDCLDCPGDCGLCPDLVRAASCARDDVAAAIEMASDGFIVLVPEGRCAWERGVRIEGKGIHLRGEREGAVVLVHDAGSATLVAVTADDSHAVEISDLRFEEGTGGADAWDGMFLSVGGSGRPVLVHHDVFETRNAGRRSVRWNVNRGVLWSNEFLGNGADANAIAFLGPTSSWTSPPTMGTDDASGESNVYVEDNVFRRFPFQTLDPDSNSRVVIRHNTFDECGLASHGADTSEHGTRHWELYDNTFLFTDDGDCDGSRTANLPYLFYIRGGTGVIADNAIPDVRSCAWGDKPEIFMTIQNLRRDAGPYPCWTEYPAPRQVGQGHDGAMPVTDPVYLWGNTGGGNYDAPAVGDYDPDECGNGLRAADFIQAGRDFFTGTPRPGYTKYAYPHPLRAGR
ncbi:MAG: hypothetical protein KF729_06635 [Sandaracinaceae bacterium]|nr:hypothetical protein [Sandaracinaceae bacterium]